MLGVGNSKLNKHGLCPHGGCSPVYFSGLCRFTFRYLLNAEKVGNQAGRNVI